MPAPSPTILADIGATNARFALLTDGVLGEAVVYPVADHASAIEAARLFLAGRTARSAILAAAGPVVDGRVTMTNAAWSVDAAQFGAAFGLDFCRVINDFAAQAWALPGFGPADLFALGAAPPPAGGTMDKPATSGGALAQPPAGETMAVMGPGTGFGLAALARGPAGDVTLVTEGGHATLAASDRREESIIRVLRDRLGHVSVERVLSGAGLLDLYHAIGTVDGLVIRERTGPEIVARALAGDCEASVATLEAFCGFLGGVAGNVALTLGATGGVFIGGGIAPRFTGFLATSAFREKFEAKGRLRPYLAAIPTAVVTHKFPAFVGLARLAEAV